MIQLATRALGTIPVQEIEITGTDLTQCSDAETGTPVVVVDANNPKLFVSQLIGDTAWRTYVGTYGAFASGSLVVPHAGADGIQAGDWIQIMGRFYQFATPDYEPWASCVTVLIAADAPQGDVQFALAQAINGDASAGVVASLDVAVGGKLDFAAKEAGPGSNQWITARIASKASLAIHGLTGAPLEITRQTAVLWGLRYSTDLIGFTKDQVQELRAHNAAVVAALPAEYQAAVGDDPATGVFYVTVDNGRTWTHLTKITMDSLMHIVPSPSLHGAPVFNPPQGYSEMTGSTTCPHAPCCSCSLPPNVPRQSSPCPAVWLGETGSFPGNAGANEANYPWP